MNIDLILGRVLKLFEDTQIIAVPIEFLISN